MNDSTDVRPPKANGVAKERILDQPFVGRQDYCIGVGNLRGRARGGR